MKFDKVFLNIIEEQNILKTTKTKPIVDAIKNRHPMNFYYSGPRKPSKDSVKAGKRYRAEAVALGLSKRGNLVMRAWVAPPSTSKKGFIKTGWRTFMLGRMSNVEILTDEQFDMKRPQYHEGNDRSLSVTYVTADWTKEPKEPELPIKPQKVNIKKPSQAIPPEPQLNVPEPKITEPATQKKPISKPVKMEIPPVEPKVPQNVNPINKQPESQVKTELPQPKPKIKPKVIPNPEENNTLKENIRKRIKSLMLS